MHGDIRADVQAFPASSRVAEQRVDETLLMKTMFCCEKIGQRARRSSSSSVSATSKPTAVSIFRE